MNISDSLPMPSSLSDRPRILILRALYLGDLLCTIPAWRALRAAHPTATIALIGLPWAREIVRRFPRYLDEFIPFPGYPGLPEEEPDYDRLPAFLAEMRERHADLFLQMHGAGSYVNDLAFLCEARERAGFYPASERCPTRGRFLPYPDDISEIHRHLRLMASLDIPLTGDHLEWPVLEEDQAELDRLLQGEQAAPLEPGSYVCLHPGGRGLTRRWPVERFAAVAQALMKKGYRIVLTGTAAEASLAQRLTEGLSVPPLNLVGKTTLGSLGVLLREARLLVANDTGVSHVAAALRTPSVIVSVGSDPLRWAPLDRDRHRHLVGSETPVQDVLLEAEDLLTTRPSLVSMPTPPLTNGMTIDQLRVSVTASPLRVLTWHVHGNYLYYLTHAPHRWFLPIGLNKPGYAGRAPGFPWSDRVQDVPVDDVRRMQFDCILFQGREHFGTDQFELLSPAQRRLPRLYLEHDPPQDDPTDSKHIVDDPEMLIVHVTPFNQLMWDCGQTPTCVIEHGIPPPPAHLVHTGALARGLVVVNDMPRRGRRVGADIFERVHRTIPLDLIGMNSLPAGGLGEISHEDLPGFMCRYRFFFNPIRYTSMGLAVCEAMHLGIPIVGFATTEMATAIENNVAGYVDTNIETLTQRMAYLLAAPGEARRLGEGARRIARDRFGLDRFTQDWDRTLRAFLARHHADVRTGQSSPSPSGEASWAAQSHSRRVSSTRDAGITR
jgi:ADP-heptose:LPS heptosyltransferase